MFEFSDLRLWPFVVVALLLVITPGSDFLVVVSSALRGRTPGILAALGVCSGALTWACLAALGLVASSTANSRLFTGVTFVGIIYMMYIGLSELRAGMSGTAGDEITTSGRGFSNFAYFRRGLSVNLLNPKVGIFYIAFLPQFINHENPTFGAMLVLGLIHVLLGIVFLVSCALFVDLFRRVFASQKVARSIMVASGLLILVISLLLLWTRVLSDGSGIIGWAPTVFLRALDLLRSGYLR